MATHALDWEGKRNTIVMMFVGKVVLVLDGIHCRTRSLEPGYIVGFRRGIGTLGKVDPVLYYLMS